MEVTIETLDFKPFKVDHPIMADTYPMYWIGASGASKQKGISFAHR